MAELFQACDRLPTDLDANFGYATERPFDRRALHFGSVPVFVEPAQEARAVLWNLSTVRRGQLQYPERGILAPGSPAHATVATGVGDEHHCDPLAAQVQQPGQ